LDPDEVAALFQVTFADVQKIPGTAAGKFEDFVCEVGC
jgi:hypothetical protein